MVRIEKYNYPKYKGFNRRTLKDIEEIHHIPEELLEEIRIASLIIPFRTNNYVIKELINWQNIPKDPIFKLNFPQKKMLRTKHFEKIKEFSNNGYSKDQLKSVLEEIYLDLNPQPGGQLCYNNPIFNGKKIKGIQHKYRETILFFPSEGQMCHAFCTYCFRWAQFIGKKEFKLELENPDVLVEYIQENEGIQEILITGGDPLIMRTRKLEKYLNPLLEAKISHLKTIRIGTKSLTYWPYRFISDSDSEELLALFKRITESEIHLSMVVNFNHPNELKTEALNIARKNIQSTGAIIRTQSPILRHINDHSEIWAELLRKQVDLSMIPYYMFIPRDTGAQKYFEVPLVEAFKIFNGAYRKVSGLCRTIRGPVMSSTPGKIHIVGVTSIENKRVLALKFIQARNPKWVGRVFFAKYTPDATWIDDLEPIIGKQFFYEQDLAKYLGPFGQQDKIETEEKTLTSELVGET